MLSLALKVYTTLHIYTIRYTVIHLSDNYVFTTLEALFHTKYDWLINHKSEAPRQSDKIIGWPFGSGLVQTPSLLGTSHQTANNKRCGQLERDLVGF